MLTKDVARHTIADCRAAAVVRPATVSEDYLGQNHGEILDGLVAAAKARKWQCGPVIANLSRGGAWMTASIDLRGAVPALTSTLATLSIGVCVSNDTRHGLTFYAGGRDHEKNAAFAFESIPSIHSYTVGFETPAECEAALDKWAAQMKRADRLIEQLKARRPRERDVNRMILTAGSGHQDRRLIAPSAVTRVYGILDEIEAPSQWDVVCAFGRVMDDGPVEPRLDRLVRVWRLVTCPAVEPAAV